MKYILFDFFSKIKVTQMVHTPTIVIGTCSFIVFLLLLCNTLIGGGGLTMIGGLLLVALPFILVKLYAVDCMLEGNCDLFVNMLMWVGVVFTVVYVVAFIIVIWKRRKTDRDQLKYLVKGEEDKNGI